MTITIYYRVRLETGGLTLLFRKHWQINKIRESIREHEFWIGSFMAKYG